MLSVRMVASCLYAFGVVLGTTNAAPASVSEQLRGILSERQQEQFAAAVGQVVTQMPDDVIRWQLKVAASELEVKLGIPLGVVVCKADPVDDGVLAGVHYDRLVSRLPYTQGEANRWYRIDIPSSVISVERVRAYYFGNKIWEFSPTRGNDDQVRIEWPAQGGLHLVPRNFHQALAAVDEGSTAWGPVWHLVASSRAPVPDFWAVDYTLGPRTKETGEVDRIEAVLAHWVYCKAGIILLSIGGMARSQGITSTSISMDGFSRSVGLQASAMYGINSALETVLKTAHEAIDWKALKRYKRGLRLRMY